MERYVCIHGHFYQPPRENPWLEAIEVQDSAYPYHDWNERITTECYAPNSASRMLNAANEITAIVNNYGKISFNFGPTLLAWMQEKSPALYRAILAADVESAQRFAGHGSAMAQAYNHMILPLASARDKRTQVLWGIRDFEHRFRRRPEGLWLPETAVDLETLEVLADTGIRFTVLSPYQASHMRPATGRAWRDVSGGKIDPSTCYFVRLPSHRSMAVFFYDAPISRAIAFEDLLVRGENLAGRLCGAFSPSRQWTQLVHIATDGETYGHHRPHGDMALAYALEHIESNNLARLTNYGEFLANYPPRHEARIFENSSWSCAHGVERWKSDCGCNSGLHPGWNQAWRAPLRQALDWLRDVLAVSCEDLGSRIFKDFWRARDEYIRVMLDRSPESVDRFLAEQTISPLEPGAQIEALKLMELQRHAMLMYTSCGWFFDELSGIETVQVMQYAGRAVQLGQELFGDDIEDKFLKRLALAESNLPEHRNGEAIYEKFVKPVKVDLQKVGAHYAVSSLFEDFPEKSRIYSYDIDRFRFEVEQEGKARLALGHARIASHLTRESTVLSFGVLHLGDQNVSGGVRAYQGEESYNALAREVKEIFHRGDIPDLVRAVDRNFGAGAYSLRLLFRDEQRRIVRIIMEQALAEANALYRNFYSQYATLARFVVGLGTPLPSRFRMAIDFTLHEDLMEALSSAEPDLARIQGILEQLKKTGIVLDHVTLEFAFRHTLERAAAGFAADPFDLRSLENFDRVASVCAILPFQVNLWRAQNAYSAGRRARLHSEPATEATRSAAVTNAARSQVLMDNAGRKLGFRIEPCSEIASAGK